MGSVPSQAPVAVRAGLSAPVRFLIRQMMIRKHKEPALYPSAVESIGSLTPQPEGREVLQSGRETSSRLKADSIPLLGGGVGYLVA